MELANILMVRAAGVSFAMLVVVPRMWDLIQAMHACHVLLALFRLIAESLAVRVSGVQLPMKLELLGVELVWWVTPPLNWVARLARNAVLVRTRKKNGPLNAKIVHPTHLHNILELAPALLVL